MQLKKLIKRAANAQTFMLIR